MSEPQKIAIILPGGGCTCCFQAGALKALKEILPHTKITYCQGVSAGALNSARFISTDFLADNLIETWKQVEKEGVAAIFSKQQTLCNQLGITRYNRSLIRLIIDTDMKKLVDSTVELHIIVREEATNQALAFSNHAPQFLQNPERLNRVLLASVSLPGFMPPVGMPTVFDEDNQLESVQIYSDGCVLLPELAACQDFDLLIIISSERGTSNPYDESKKPRWMLSGMWRLISAFHYVNTYNYLKSVQLFGTLYGQNKVLVITPAQSITSLGTVYFEQGDISQFIKHGYDQAKAILLEYLKK